MYSENDIDFLCSNRKAFDDFIYTPINLAKQELNRRWQDKKISSSGSIPDELSKGFKGILFVSLVTPNYMTRRFIDLTSNIDLEPIIFEQSGDRFTSHNEWKKFLGKMAFSDALGKKGGRNYKRRNIIDFNESDGKPMNAIKTTWGEKLIDFHHNLFFNEFKNLSQHNIFDAFDWLRKNGTIPKEYYKAFLNLFIHHGVLFENFYLDEKEEYFTKEIFLPAFIETYSRTGLKPLIVSLEPIETEGDQFWYSHTLKTLQEVDQVIKDNSKTLLPNDSASDPKSETTCTISVANSKHGKGTFATRDITKGEEFYQYKGEFIDFKTCQSYGEGECYPIQFADINSPVCYLKAEAPGCFINHYCNNPNAGLNGKLQLVALRDIKKGEEVFFDYSTCMMERSWTMKCECDDPNCRGTIQDFDQLSDTTQLAFLKAGVVQPFIIEAIKNEKYFIGQNHLGKAAIAKFGFYPGEVILKFAGKKFIETELPATTDNLHYYMQIGNDLYLGPSGKADDFVNHSCKPNAGLIFTDSDIYLIAIKFIPPAEEVTWDYSTTTFNTKWSMTCHCKKQDCRGIVGDFLKLEPAKKKYYASMGIIPSYIKEYLKSNAGEENN